MKAGILGAMVLLAGTATVFAATHKTLNDDSIAKMEGTAGFINVTDGGLGLEVEYAGLKPGTLYIVRLENSACENLPRTRVSFSNGPSIAMFIEPNEYGSYHTVMNPLPEKARDSGSIVLYNTGIDTANEEITTAYCQNIG